MGIFGQIVIGPPGSGKSTYCRAMHEFMTGMVVPVYSFMKPPLTTARAD